ncbi:MAG: HAD hydrolase family protein [Bacteroidales bacterium]
MSNYREFLKDIKAFVFDVDGVFTDGKVFILPDGSQIRNMNVKDGYAVHYASKKGYPIGIITGAKCDSLRIRFNELGLFDIYLASPDKLVDFNHCLTKYSLKPEEIMYMGDDLPDVKVMEQVILPACPSDACEEVKAISKYISYAIGGNGCVRDIIEQTLKVQGKWLDKDAFVW